MTRTITVELSDEEHADLHEMVERHPGDFANEGAALKHMAGLPVYRRMKQTLDPERRRGPVLVQDLGIPEVIPCAMWEVLDRTHRTYQDFVDGIVADGLARLQDAINHEQFEHVKVPAENGGTRNALAIRSTELDEFAKEYPGVMLMCKVEEGAKEPGLARPVLLGRAVQAV